MPRKSKRAHIPQGEFTCKINQLSHEGRGVADMNGKKTFIFGGLSDETVEFKYTNTHRSYDEGAVTRVIEAAKDRVTPQCEYFGVCAGCSLQHLSTEGQLKHKEKILLEHFKHQAHCEPKVLLAPIQGNAWHYRRKARLSVKHVPGKNKVLMGFREHDPRFIANISHCAVLDERVGNNLSNFSDLLMQLDAKNTIPQIEIAIGDNLTAIIIRHLEPLSEKDLKLLIEFTNQNQYQLYLQPGNYDSIYCIKNNYAEEKLYYDLEQYQLRFYFHPTQFIQVNADINKKMIVRAIELLDLNSNDVILDLFCGIGNFSLPLAQLAKKVIGVEGSQSAITQAQKNADDNKINNIEFYVHDLTKNCGSESWAKQAVSKVLLDPPRAGAAELMPYFSTLKPSRIVYVSCNPITLARDAKTLLDLGYTLDKAGVMDMFPHTEHVEAIALFSRADEKIDESIKSMDRKS